MPIIRIEYFVKSKEEFDKIKEENQLADEIWTFIEKKQLFSEKVKSFMGNFLNENNIGDESELLIDFFNYLRDIEKKEIKQKQELEIRIEARNMYTDVNMEIGENQLETIALHFFKKGLEQNKG